MGGIDSANALKIIVKKYNNMTETDFKMGITFSLLQNYPLGFSWETLMDLFMLSFYLEESDIQNISEYDFIELKKVLCFRFREKGGEKVALNYFAGVDEIYNVVPRMSTWFMKK